MRARIIRIGNSHGIRIPKPFLVELGLEDEVELTVSDDGLVVAPVPKTRAGWSEAFRDMARRGEDTLVVDDQAPLSSWDEEEWEWW